MILIGEIRDAESMKVAGKLRRHLFREKMSIVSSQYIARVTHANSKTLFKLDGQDSPYWQSQRLFQMVRLLPIGSTMNAAAGAVTTDYGQYLLFIRNSDWATP